MKPRVTPRVTDAATDVTLRVTPAAPPGMTHASSAQGQPRATAPRQGQQRDGDRALRAEQRGQRHSGVVEPLDGRDPSSFQRPTSNFHRPRGSHQPRQPRLTLAVRLFHRHRWLLAILVCALVVGQLPLLVSTCCAPAGMTGVGSVWFINDFAQYESAMRQGADQSGWLVKDPFTAEPHQPTFMFPLYVALGKLASTLQLPASTLERVMEAAARVVLVVALWRFCRSFARGRSAARWALLLSLFAGGFEIFAALLGMYSGNWSYETNGFGLLFAAPHVPLGMAATLELAREGLRPARTLSRALLLKVLLLTSALALLHPFHVPVLLGAMLLCGLVFWRSGRGMSTLAVAATACLGAVPVLLPTVVNFSFDPFWVATYSLQNQLPSPAPHELLVELGPTFLLAVAGVILLRTRVAAFGLLVWLLLELIAMYFPVPYQRRLSFGIQPTCAVLAATTLVVLNAELRPRYAQLLRLGTVATAASGTLLVLVSVVASSFTNAPLAVYRSTRDLDAAIAWLDAHAKPDEVILADWQTANYVAPRTPARVFGGHPVATLNATQKQLAVREVFAHESNSLAVARSFGAHWLVFGPEEAGLAAPPSADFEAGVVRVYRTDR